MVDVSCIGILTADVLVKPVEMLPEKGLLSIVDRLDLFVGGCASNAAIDLAKLGASVQIFGKVGNDSFGSFVTEEIRNAGVNIDGLCIDDNAQTSASVVTISEDGERSILHCFGANAKFCFDDIDFEKIKRAKILFVAGAFLMPSFDGDGAHKLLKMAKDEGILCCMDTAWDFSGVWMDKIKGCLPYLDWFMPSFDEAVMLSKEKKNIEEIAKEFISLGAKNVVIKLGPNGCYVRVGNQNSFYNPAYGNISVIDSSGAGDSFCAGFLMGLAQKWNFKKCAEFANAVGAHCVMQMGTTTGIKSMNETLKFIEERR